MAGKRPLVRGIAAAPTSPSILRWRKVRLEEKELEEPGIKASVPESTGSGVAPAAPDVLEP